MVMIDVGILAISSLVLCASLVFSYVDISKSVEPQCSVPPKTFIVNITEAINQVNSAIFSSKSRVLVAADGLNVSCALEALKNATKRGVPVSVIMNEDSQELRNAGVTNITVGNLSFGFVVVDTAAFVFSGVFADSANRLTALTHITECSWAVDDVAGFFDFQYLRLNDRIPHIVPIDMHAKTSLIKPLALHPNSSMYFFHNPVECGDPLRIATSNFLPQSLYIDANEKPMSNISLYVDDVPAPNNGTNPSLFTVLKRILIKVSKDSGPAKNIFVRLLVPKSGNTTDKQRWIRSIASFNNADVRLYEDTYKGVNFIEVGGRVFIFSHTLNDGPDANQLGFHMSTNSTDVVDTVTAFWNTMWTSATPFVNY